MQLTIFKISDPIHQMRSGCASQYRFGLKSFSGGFKFRVLKLLLIIVCVIGVLGCQRSNRSGSENSGQRFRQGKVVGSSMAPHFLGEHFQVQCVDCRSEVVADLDQSKTRRDLVCPFCGCEIALSSCRKQTSDRVRIELDSGSISRWDVVAFHVPGTQEAGIKRVVGLPGETIEIRGGNLWLGESMIRKPVAAQKRTRILIHDSGKTDPQKLAWRAIDSAGLSSGAALQRFTDGKFIFEGNADEANGSEFKWLEFCNRRNYEHYKESLSEAGERRKYT